MVVDRNLKVIYCNEAMTSFLSVSDRTLRRASNINECVVISPPLLEGINLDEIIIPTVYRELIFESSNRHKSIGQVSILPAGANEGELGHWLIFIKDVTLEERLQSKYRKEMQQKQTMIEALAKTSTALNKKLIELSMLLRIANITSSLSDLGIIIETVFKELFNFFKFKYGAITIYKSSNNSIYFDSFHTNPLRSDAGADQKEVLLNIEHDQSSIASVLTRENALYLKKDDHKDLFRLLTTSIKDEITDSIITTARSKGRLLGLVWLMNSPQGWVEKPEDLNLMDSIVSQLGIILENSDLYKSSITDGLTTLHNVSYFRSVLNSEIKQTLRYGHSLSLILFDIDHFKSFNDKYGHQTGDLVLKEVARVCKEMLRTSDIAARYGGEEFAVMCPATDLNGALNVAERLRANVQNNKIIHQGIELSVTISIGVAEVSKESSSVESVISQADQALYAAKRAGRNNVKSFSQIIPLEIQKKAQ